MTVMKRMSLGSDSTMVLRLTENDYSEDNKNTWVVVLAVVLSFLGLVLLIGIIAVVVRHCCLKKKSK